MARYEDINTRLVAAVGLISVLAVVGRIVGIQALFKNFEQNEVERKVLAVEAINAKNLLAEQETQRNRLGWIDRENRLIVIPVERAMELVVQELRAQANIHDEYKQAQRKD